MRREEYDMTKSGSKKELIDVLSNFFAHNKGLLVFTGIGLAIVGLILNCIPAWHDSAGLVGWLVRSDLFLHLGVIVGLLGILLGDAL